MPKILCIASLVVAAILFLVFLANMLTGMPFGNADGALLMNIGMLVGSLIVGIFSVLTYLEAR